MKKIADGEKAPGIAVDEPSEIDVALEEICKKSDASDRDQQAISKERRDKVEKEQKEAEDIRAKALEKVGQTRKRVLADDDTDADSNSKSQRHGRRTGGETISYLQQKEFQIRLEELKQQLASQQKQQKDMAEQLVRQQEQQQTTFANFQQQQQQ